MKHEEKEMADRMIQILNAIIRKMDGYYCRQNIVDYCLDVKKKIEQEKLKMEKKSQKCPVCGSTRFNKCELGKVCQRCGYRNDVNINGGEKWKTNVMNVEVNQ